MGITMPDAVGYRIKFGVIIPSTNTVVEADYNRMAPPGVTFHAGRMYVSSLPSIPTRPSKPCSARSGSHGRSLCATS